MMNGKNEMSRERWNLLTETGCDLTEAEMVAGWHWCAEWDGMPIGPGMPEAICCNCGVPQVEEWKASPEAREMMREQQELNEEYEILSRQQAQEKAQLNEATDKEAEMTDEEFFETFGDADTDERGEQGDQFRSTPE